MNRQLVLTSLDPPAPNENPKKGVVALQPASGISLIRLSQRNALDNGASNWGGF